jgi:hypothetical protein
MAQAVADVMWEMLVKTGVKRCCGIGGDALNPAIDALRRSLIGFHRPRGYTGILVLQSPLELVQVGD